MTSPTLTRGSCTDGRTCPETPCQDTTSLGLECERGAADESADEPRGWGGGHQLGRSGRAQQSPSLPALSSRRSVCIYDSAHCSPPSISSSSFSTVLSLPLQDELLAGQGSRPIHTQWPTHSAISRLSRERLRLALEIKHWSCLACMCVWDVKKIQHVSRGGWEMPEWVSQRSFCASELTRIQDLVFKLRGSETRYDSILSQSICHLETTNIN